MRIVYVLPTLSACGGVRVVFEQATRLAERGHEVSLVSPELTMPTWFDLTRPVMTHWEAARSGPWDVAIATSPNTLTTCQAIPASKRVYFVQMMEHLFERPGSAGFRTCLDSYREARLAGFKFITISNWLKTELEALSGATDTPILPNGINRDHFYPETSDEGSPYLLVEGDNRNYAKDVNGIGWQVALTLAQRHGLRVVGFAGSVHNYSAALDTFMLRPSVPQMRRLYSNCRLFIKASRFEGRSLSPLEALACGAPVARAILRGDDDLVDGQNCVRTTYDQESFLQAVERLLMDEAERIRLRQNALNYAQERLGWTPIMDQLERLLVEG